MSDDGKKNGKPKEVRLVGPSMRKLFEFRAAEKQAAFSARGKPDLGAAVLVRLDLIIEALDRIECDEARRAGELQIVPEGGEPPPEGT